MMMMMMTTKKKCRKKPEKPMTHRREGDDMPQYKQTPKTMQFKSTQMEKCLRVRIHKIIIDGQTEMPIDRIETLAYSTKEISGYEKNFVCYRSNLEPNRRHTTANTGRRAKAPRLLAKQHDTTHHILEPLKNLRERRGNVIRQTDKLTFTELRL